MAALPPASLAKGAAAPHTSLQGALMLHSRDRILTTHVGSLPRNDGADRPADPPRGRRGDRPKAMLGAEMDQRGARTRRGAGGGRHRHRQRRRAAAGRLPDLHPARMSGFGGESKRKVGKDFQEVPELIEMFLRRFPRRAKISNAPQAIAEVRYLDTKDHRGRDRPLQARCAAAAGASSPRRSLTAPSPGIVATTMMNAHYKSHEAYLMALARELRPEYRAIHEAGLILQIDAPDLAMERTMTFQDLSETEFLRVCELHVAAINKAHRGHSARPRAAALLLGQLGGPARPRHRARAHPADPLPGARRRAHHRVRQPAPSARIRGAARQPAAQGLAADPRRDRHHHQLRRAPRGRGAAASRRPWPWWATASA